MTILFIPITGTFISIFNILCRILFLYFGMYLGCEWLTSSWCIYRWGLLPEYSYFACSSLIHITYDILVNGRLINLDELWEQIYQGPNFKVSFTFILNDGYRINAKSDMLQLLSKTVYVFMFTFFHQEEYGMFKSVILCIFSTVVFLSCVTNKPYFNPTT